MMTTMICTECSEPKTVTSRSVVLPFVCEECQKAPELLAAMAPASCGSATVENTTLLIEDQANQLALAKNEVESLRALNTFLEGREAALYAQNSRLQDTVENLLVKNFFKDEKIATLAKQAEALGIDKVKLSQETFRAYFESFLLKITNSKQIQIINQLRRELLYAASRLFALAADNGRLENERDMWQKRALIAKRCYDRASADRRYYRGKLKDAGIKA
jgi:hypothetical protein